MTQFMRSALVIVREMFQNEMQYKHRKKDFESSLDIGTCRAALGLLSVARQTDRPAALRKVLVAVADMAYCLSERGSTGCVVAAHEVTLTAIDHIPRTSSKRKRQFAPSVAA